MLLLLDYWGIIIIISPDWRVLFKSMCLNAEIGCGAITQTLTHMFTEVWGGRIL